MNRFFNEILPALLGAVFAILTFVGVTFIWYDTSKAWENAVVNNTFKTVVLKQKEGTFWKKSGILIDLPEGGRKELPTNLYFEGDSVVIQEVRIKHFEKKFYRVKEN